MSGTKSIIPVLGAQYLANPKEVAASLTEAEKEARTIALLKRVEAMGGMVMLIPEPTNKHNPNAVLARHMGVSVGYVSDDYLELVHRALRASGDMGLPARITEVKVRKHGYIKVELSEEEEDRQLKAVLRGVDWTTWMVDVPLLPVSEEQLCETEAQMMLKMTPFTRDSLEMLRFNLDLWMRGSRNDLSREAREMRSRYIELLERAPDADVRELAEEVKHQRNAICGERMMTERVETWWQEMLMSQEVRELWEKWMMKCKNRYREALEMIDSMLRLLPGELYGDIGDLRRFLSRLYYMKVPVKAYYSILTLLLLRQLTCRELRIDNVPLAESDGRIEDMELMPATIGQVLAFGRTQCELPIQRATVQMLANWLRDEYNNTHCGAAEELTRKDDAILQQTEAIREQTAAMTAVASRPATQINQLNMQNGSQQLPSGVNIPYLLE